MFVGTNPSYTTYELEHALKISKTKYIIAEPDLLRAPKAAAQKLAIPNEHILLFADNDDSHKSWRFLLQHGSQYWAHFDDLETSKNTTAFLLFSSGTTGLPKAAQVSHYNLIAQHTLVHENPQQPSPFGVSMLCALPFFHAAHAP